MTEQQIEQLPTGRALFSLILSPPGLAASGLRRRLGNNANCASMATGRVPGIHSRWTTINAPVSGANHQSVDPVIQSPDRIQQHVGE